MVTVHGRSPSNFSWERKDKFKLTVAVPAQSPFSPLSPVLKAARSPPPGSAFTLTWEALAQAANFLLCPTSKRTAFHWLPISPVERCHIDTLIDWEEISDPQAEYLSEAQKTPLIASPELLIQGSVIQMYLFCFCACCSES